MITAKKRSSWTLSKDCIPVCYNCEEIITTDNISEDYSKPTEYTPMVCITCEESMDDKTGFCSWECQLSGECDDSC